MLQGFAPAFAPAFAIPQNVSSIHSLAVNVSTGFPKLRLQLMQLVKAISHAIIRSCNSPKEDIQILVAWSIMSCCIVLDHDCTTMAVLRAKARLVGPADLASHARQVCS